MWLAGNSGDALLISALNRGTAYSIRMAKQVRRPQIPRFPGTAAEWRCRWQKGDVVKHPTRRAYTLPRGEERAEFPNRGVRPDTEERRGGSGGGNGGIVPRTGSCRVGRVGPSGRKITRARNQKRPGTSGGGRNPEGEASNRDSFRRKGTPNARHRVWEPNPPMGRLPKGSGP
jgi:hypothetical protein